MASRKKWTKIIYRVVTIGLALFILPGIFFINEPFAIAPVQAMGIPERLRLEAGIGTFIGGLILLLPIRWRRIREWGYVGLGIVYLTAMIGHGAIDGWMNPITYSPLVAFAVLLISYIYYHKMLAMKRAK